MPRGALGLAAVLPRFPPEGPRELRQRERYPTWTDTLRDVAAGWKWKMSYLMTRRGTAFQASEGKIPERALQMIRKISLFRNVDSNKSDRAREHGHEGLMACGLSDPVTLLSHPLCNTTPPAKNESEDTQAIHGTREKKVCLDGNKNVSSFLL